ncbi:MAG: carboxypeptidase regulatory-like domain-containing protein [Planctomycetes bacterium]|nr:carboxypeptidase regulatory-like domain-containing protein [Planctomycetota bacterium]
MQGGELRWPLCPVGRVRVQIVGQGYAPWTAERDLVANEEHQLGEVLLEPGGVLQGRVVDPAGAPVANACVLVGEEADLDLFEPQVRSGPDGSFRIGGITTGASSLVVRAPGLAPRTVELRLPQDVLAEPPLVIALEPGSAIVVEVGPGRAREGGLVQLRRRGRVIATAELDEAGRAVFLHRSPGSYTVQLYGSDEPPKPARVESAGQQVRVQL